MSPTVVDQKLSSLEHRYAESIHRALAQEDHATAARLGASYDAKARRLQELRDPGLNPLRRMALQTMTRIG
ncbi:hypothetical protein ASG88_17915 [Nocardioides sp. Soil777]|uniref:hypothetical protein n=1 Tax=Nocardioides sp. Soil777 TaxID=1736409 RepID=UPI000702B880|nr:hypothetical protein [Nocardioides sp. Soil777]KRE98049.1 hypothetical protein ASG88_17915 [Nocardioides sp. Soil777]